jgi:uncharacterized protein YbaR (Trm112 family)
VHVLLTDLLTCPRCGPTFGLILLSREMRDRRVLEGFLGCANCRERWSIRGGFGEFRAPLGMSAEQDAGEGEAAASARDAHEDADGEPIRIAALLGVTEGPAWVLLAGPAAARASQVASLIEQLEVVAADRALEQEPEVPGVSRIAVAGRLPFYNARLHGVWLSGAQADELLEEGARALSPLGRLVLEPAPSDVEARLSAAGLRVVARKGETLVAARAG